MKLLLLMLSLFVVGASSPYSLACREGYSRLKECVKPMPTIRAGVMPPEEYKKTKQLLETIIKCIGAPDCELLQKKFDWLVLNFKAREKLSQNFECFGSPLFNTESKICQGKRGSEEEKCIFEMLMSIPGCTPDHFKILWSFVQDEDAQDEAAIRANALMQ